jgi:hypothetical protein
MSTIPPALSAVMITKASCSLGHPSFGLEQGDEVPEREALHQWQGNG